ncbi:VCBS repeat-containing protein [Spirosoma sp. BT702]|uniref:VCBS repeat-containing protein n=1 Tax=Spirosoma profusum TaxID=2771354 RepID=A0A926Y4T3_9BACT|nr:VCBS repeat-containing protein [Spirosoma profusum]MBD2703700.1 VCBS repeat-containing protein [Spirosoma profusum]
MNIRQRRITSYSPYLLSFIIACLVINSCRVDNSDKLRDPILLEGQQLAQKHCSNCHQFPAPDLLDKETWIQHILPAMAPKLGLESYPGGQYYAGRDAAISFNDWQKLVAYYQALAPIKLKPAKVPVDPEEDWAIFSLQKPQVDTSQTAITTLVAMDTAGHQLFSSDGIRSDLTRWNQQLQPTKFRQLPSAAVNVQFLPDAKGNRQGVFTSMGTMRAIDGMKGEVVSLGLSDNQLADSSTISTDLPRPLQSVPVDINKDGLTDWVVCGFGHSKGGLYWLKQESNGKFSRQSIRDVAGPLQTIVNDFNADGWSDLMVLFAHADEGIWLFLNNKKGGFSERNVLRFPAVYGSTSFQLVDFNKDGRQDILYTCGDNSDYSPILKPYHGVYIYLNQGDFRYKQAYFYPINGCTKAVATDFDKDGDLDIMSIAFFADFQDNPSEGCLYFEQQEPMKFLPHTLPITTYGRWICMDVNDFDQDGDADVVLGNFSKTFIIQKDLKPTWDTHLPLILLKNKTR